jgi:N6-adenosine-specific RNA methylase IME4
MSIAEIMALPVREIVESNAHLYLWTPSAFIVEAHAVCRAWGFEQKNVLTWGKVRRDGNPRAGCGFHFRGATEHCVFAVRGSMKLLGGGVEPTLFLHERLPHSVKPEAFMEMVERRSPGPYLELFARRKRPGWTVWGNEVSDLYLRATDDPLWQIWNYIIESGASVIELVNDEQGNDTKAS